MGWNHFEGEGKPFSCSDNGRDWRSQDPAPRRDYAAEEAAADVRRVRELKERAAKMAALCVSQEATETHGLTQTGGTIWWDQGRFQLRCTMSAVRFNWNPNEELWFPA